MPKRPELAKQFNIGGRNGQNDEPPKKVPKWVTTQRCNNHTGYKRTGLLSGKIIIVQMLYHLNRNDNLKPYHVNCHVARPAIYTVLAIVSGVAREF